MIIVRVEAWTKDGDTAHVDVVEVGGMEGETVVVAYELLADMMRQLGFEKDPTP